MIRSRLVGPLALAPACFSPHYNLLKCGVGDSCPSGYVCRDGNCESRTPDDAAPGDGTIGNDGPSSRVCLGSFVKVCVDVPPVALELSVQTIDTSDAGAMKCQPYDATPMVDACVIAAQTITVPSGNTVTATGPRRLILLATGALTIAGTLDAGSHRAGLRGPAADTGPCPTNFTNPTVLGQGGGGWGGTLGGPGNNGGHSADGAIGGIAGSSLAITALGGGCAGGDGAGVSGGSGGHGGGALLLLSGQTISIAGTVTASGAGGDGGKTAAAAAGGGGGGGGAGGMIVLDAPSVLIPGRCFANGGGGGEGSSLIAGGGGGESAAPDMAGSGGSGASIGGAGGAGGLGTIGSLLGANGGSIVNPVVDAGGGGGGGGGVGIIKIFAPSQQDSGDPHKVSPPPS